MKKSVDIRKQILVKALVDPRFRKKLFTSPEALFDDEGLPTFVRQTNCS